MTIARDKKTCGETKVLESVSSRTTHTSWCLAACPWKFILANTQLQNVGPCTMHVNKTLLACTL